MFKKSKLLEREGFYVVLFVCLCIIGVTGVYISKNGSRTHKTVAQNAATNKSDFQRSTSPRLTQNDVDLKDQTAQTSGITAKSVKDELKQQIHAKGKAATVHKVKAVHKKTDSFKIIYPVKGAVTKGFAKDKIRLTKSLGIWETHEGIDIACELGTEVKAAAGGKVAEVDTKTDSVHEDRKDGYGAGIMINHEDGFKTYYANLDPGSIKLHKGDSVKAGDVIGLVGDSSKREQIAVEQSHLHFQVYKKEGGSYTTVDPANYLK